MVERRDLMRREVKRDCGEVEFEFREFEEEGNWNRCFTVSLSCSQLQSKNIVESTKISQIFTRANLNFSTSCIFSMKIFFSLLQITQSSNISSVTNDIHDCPSNCLTSRGEFSISFSIFFIFLVLFLSTYKKLIATKYNTV
jgi:hypothetical protein